MVDFKSEVDSRTYYEKIKEAFASSKAAIDNSDFLQELKIELIKILKNKEEFGKTDVAHLLDVLEPSNQGQSLSQEEKQAAIEIIANKCLKNPLFVGKQGKVMTEWAHWLAGTGIFARDNRRYAWDAINTMDEGLLLGHSPGSSRSNAPQCADLSCFNRKKLVTQERNAH